MSEVFDYARYYAAHLPRQCLPQEINADIETMTTGTMLGGMNENASR